MYTKAKMLFCGYQLVSVSQCATRCCHLRADHKQSELGTGQGSCAVILLVSPLLSLTIAKFNSVHPFFQLCTHTAFKYLVRILLHVGNLRKDYNFTEI